MKAAITRLNHPFDDEVGDENSPVLILYFSQFKQIGKVARESGDSESIIKGVL